MTELFLSQITDPFRIGLTVMMLFTASRTADAVGYWIPLALGVVFISVLIPTSMSADDGDVARQIAMGLVSTALLLGVMLGLKAIITTVARRPSGD